MAEIVGRGYDRIGRRYTAWAKTDLSPGRRHALTKISELVPEGAVVLDLGCGAGLPMTRLMADRYHVTGIDSSARQVERARQNVPQASFEQADMSSMQLPAASYDAVVAFYSLTHLKRSDLGPLLTRVGSWLRPHGVFIASFAARDNPGTLEQDWFGVPMFFSGFEPRINLALIVGAGFEILDATIVVDPEHAGLAEFLWVTARKP